MSSKDEHAATVATERARAAKQEYILKGSKADMRRSIDGLMAIVRDIYELDPYSNPLFLFCGKRCDRLKALHFDKDGFVLLYKRLDSGRFQWPRNSQEVKKLTRQEFRWLMEGLSVEQPKAIKPITKKPLLTRICLLQQALSD